MNYEHSPIGMQMRRPGWWRGPAVTSWAQYRVDREKLPSGCSPLLVFLNTKSGAQTGAAMRRRFLRLLNLSGACFYFAAICGIISLLQSSATYAEATLDLSPLTMSWITYTHLFCSQTSACELSASLWRLRVCY